MRSQLRFLCKEDGSILIETSASLGIVLLLLFGTMEFSQLLFADVFIGYASHAATRYAMVRGASWNPSTCSPSVTSNCTAAASDVRNYVKSIAPFGVDTTSSLVVSPTWPGTSASGGNCVATNGPATPGCVVQIRVDYNFHFALPFVSATQIPLRSTSSVTIVQ